MIAVLAAMFVLPRFWPSNEGKELSYTEFLTLVNKGEVKSVVINNASNKITGQTVAGDEFTTTGGGQRGLSEADEAVLKEKRVDIDFKTPTTSWFWSWAGLLLPFLLLIGFFVWMQRRAMGQAGSIMSVGKSRAFIFVRSPIEPFGGNSVGF